MNSILITNSGINSVSGGGVVSLNLLQALQAVSDVKLILSNQRFENDNYNGLPAFSINPLDFGYAPPWRTSPFLMDYIASLHLPDLTPTHMYSSGYAYDEPPIQLCITYSDPFGITVEKLKQKGVKVICDLAPHDIALSQEEHIKFTGQYNYPHLTNPKLLHAYLKHLRIANAVVTHSKKSSQYIKETAGLTELPTVIPHGCYIPETIPPFPDKFMPSYFGAIGHDKGVIYLINAIINCPPGMQLLIGGSMAQNFKVEDEFMHRFRITGFVENLYDFYKQASVYIQASVTEGFGLTVLDAASYGRPVICAEGAGVAELITDGREGFVVPIRDIQAISSKIQYYYDNPSEIRRMGQNARKLAERYSWTKIKEEYINLFQKVL